MRDLLFLVLVTTLLPAADRKTRHLVLVTADGLRRQEIFSGIDPRLMREKAAHMDKEDDLRRQYWAETPAGRREKLFPFLWKTLVPQGVILGNMDRGSTVAVTNAYRVSYPGYSEILTCRAQDERIRNNDPVQNPIPTVLEYVQQQWRLNRSQVALFGSWNRFRQIGESRPGSIFLNAGYQDSDATPRIAELSRAQHEALSPWGEVRHDYITFEMALDYLRTFQPRVLYLSLGETDDWAHDKRYDRVLQTAHYFDRAIERLWQTLQSLPEYRDSTSLVLTADHGRGSNLDDWDSHGNKIAGAEFIWIAALGPDTAPRGEIANAGAIHQRDVAATLLSLAGLDWRAFCGGFGRPIPQIAGTEPRP
jgi:hypothetical protein